MTAKTPSATPLPAGICDLGKLTGSVLICGGAYGNLEALFGLADAAAALGIGPGNIIHTGDVAAYCASPERSSRLVRAKGWHAIKGNVEEQLAAGGDDCGCGFAPGSACAVASGTWFRFAGDAISPATRDWMAGLPAQLRFSLAGRRFAVVHGAPSQTGKFMFASTADDEFAAELDLAGCDGVIAGHTGLPFTRMTGQRLWHNCGALGMPANDGTVRVWYSVLQPVTGGIKITHHALAYDYRATVAKMRACDLPEGYARNLESGLWPATDILPARETAITGKRLTMQPVIYQGPV